MKGAVISGLAGTLLAGCASMSPSATTATYFAVYDLPGQGGRAILEQVEDAVAASSKEATGEASAVDQPPPSPLPTQPGRFKLLSAGSNTLFNAQDPSAVSQFAYALTNAGCPGSPYTVSGQNVDNASVHIKTLYCVYPYAKGIQVDVVMITSQSSGFSGNPVQLFNHVMDKLTNSADLGPEHYMDRVFSDLAGRLAKLNAKSAVVDSYLPKPPVAAS